MMSESGSVKLSYRIIAGLVASFFFTSSIWSVLVYGVLANVANDPQAAFPFLLMACLVFSFAIVWGIACFGLLQQMQTIGNAILWLTFVFGAAICCYLFVAVQ